MLEVMRPSCSAKSFHMRVALYNQTVRYVVSISNIAILKNISRCCVRYFLAAHEPIFGLDIWNIAISINLGSLTFLIYEVIVLSPISRSVEYMCSRQYKGLLLTLCFCIFKTKPILKLITIFFTLNINNSSKFPPYNSPILFPSTFQN